MGIYLVENWLKKEALEFSLKARNVNVCAMECEEKSAIFLEQTENRDDFLWENEALNFEAISGFIVGVDEDCSRGSSQDWKNNEFYDELNKGEQILCEEFMESTFFDLNNEFNAIPVF